jgi:hypothetical protein
MPTDVQNTLIALRQQCCQRTTLTITGGTEQGVHKNSTNTATYGSHGPGGNAVDIAPNPSLTTFITGSSRTPNAGYSTTKNINGKTVRFLYEVADGHSTGPHWHVATF